MTSGFFNRSGMPTTGVPATQWEKQITQSGRTLAEFDLPSQPGNEKIAMAEVVSLISPYNLSAMLVERIKTGVAEAAMNAMEHGNHYLAEVPVQFKVLIERKNLIIQIVDQGSGPEFTEPEMPDIEAKLSGLQSPRGWGLFLIQNMVDELGVTTTEGHHRLDLIFNLETPPE